MSVKPLPKRNALVVHTEIDGSAMVFLAVSAGSNKRSVSLDVNVMARLEVPSKHLVSSYPIVQWFYSLAIFFCHD